MIQNRSAQPKMILVRPSASQRDAARGRAGEAPRVGPYFEYAASLPTTSPRGDGDRGAEERSDERRRRDRAARASTGAADRGVTRLRTRLLLDEGHGYLRERAVSPDAQR